MNYHFIGINGVSMSGLAKLMAELGHQVSGCDLRQIPNSKSQIANKFKNSSYKLTNQPVNKLTIYQGHY